MKQHDEKCDELKTIKDLKDHQAQELENAFRN